MKEFNTRQTSFKDLIITLHRKYEVSHRMIAKLCRVSPVTVSNWLSQTNTPKHNFERNFKRLTKLAQYLEEN
jgi:predicted transcriptional regulator